LIYIDYYVQDAFLSCQHLVAVFLDLEQAYNTNWRYGIFRNLHPLNLRGFPTIVSLSFPPFPLLTRSVRECVLCDISQENGVPQGSILSAILFANPINILVKAVGPSVATSLYVDNVAIFYDSRSTLTVERRLQGGVSRLSLWVQGNKFSFSHDRGNLHSDPCLSEE
jgi:hypothetical protein